MVCAEGVARHEEQHEDEQVDQQDEGICSTNACTKRGPGIGRNGSSQTVSCAVMSMCRAHRPPPIATARRPDQIGRPRSTARCQP